MEALEARDVRGRLTDRHPCNYSKNRAESRKRFTFHASLDWGFPGLLPFTSCLTIYEWTVTDDMEGSGFVLSFAEAAGLERI